MIIVYEKYISYSILPTIHRVGTEQTYCRSEGCSLFKGTVKIAVYNREDRFLKVKSVFRSNSASTNEGLTEVLIDDLPNGEYALAVFHDENSNHELDTNWLGIPKKPVGFSNARLKTFRPPSFKECSFEMISDKAVFGRIVDYLIFTILITFWSHPSYRWRGLFFHDKFLGLQ